MSYRPQRVSPISAIPTRARSDSGVLGKTLNTRGQGGAHLIGLGPSPGVVFKVVVYVEGHMRA